MVPPRHALTLATPVGLRSETVRSANLSTILRALHLDGPLSRSELVARTGLTRSSIGALVGELARVGLVEELRAVSGGNRGRPSTVAGVVPERNVVISVEVAVDSVAVAAVGLGGAVLHVLRRSRTRDRVDVEVTISDIVEMSVDVIALLRPDCRVHGIGAGVVGLVRRSDNFVSIAPNLGWRDVPFGARLGAALGGGLPVVLANDADVAALAEVRRGVAVGVAEMLYVWGEVGVGGGLISRGEMITGVAGFAGEVGHMPVNPDGRECQCGAVGCWETEVGEDALLRRAGLAPDGGRDAIDDVLAAAAAGSSVALRALDEEARWLGIGLAGLINILNPAMVVLGGLFDRVHPFTAVTIQRELERRVLASARAHVRVVPSALGADAALLGAAELAFEAVLNDPLGVMSTLHDVALVGYRVTVAGQDVEISTSRR